MTATTPKGVPYYEMDDPPNIPAATQGIAEWIDDTLTASAQQVMTGDPTQDNGIAWRYPRARTGSLTEGLPGDLGYVGGSRPLVVWNGSAWVNVTPDMAPVPRGLIADAVHSGAQNITAAGSWVTLSGMSVNVPFVGGRRYKITASVHVQISATPGDVKEGFEGRILVGGVALVGGQFMWQRVLIPTSGLGVELDGCRPVIYDAPTSATRTVTAQGIRGGFAPVMVTPPGGGTGRLLIEDVGLTP